jgi:hypothetical protein
MENAGGGDFERGSMHAEQTPAVRARGNAPLYFPQDEQGASFLYIPSYTNARFLNTLVQRACKATLVPRSSYVTRKCPV